MARQRKKEEQTAEKKRKVEEKAMKMKTTRQRKKKKRKEETSSEDEGSWVPSDGSSTNDVTLDVEDTTEEGQDIMQLQENIEPLQMKLLD